jgi:hypothetical protein
MDSYLDMTCHNVTGQLLLRRKRYSTMSTCNSGAILVPKWGYHGPPAAAPRHYTRAGKAGTFNNIAHFGSGSASLSPLPFRAIS